MARILRLLKSGLSGGNLAAMADEYRTRQSSDREKLERMMAYGQSAACRWALLLDYFGEADDDAALRQLRQLPPSARGTGLPAERAIEGRGYR